MTDLCSERREGECNNCPVGIEFHNKVRSDGHEDVQVFYSAMFRPRGEFLVKHCPGEKALKAADNKTA